MSEEKNQKVPFIQDLWYRRIPQIMIAYIITIFGIMEFIDMIVNRYLLSPHLFDLALTILLSIVPSIALITFFHGKSGHDKIHKSEKVVVPLNFIALIALIIIIFHEKDLGSVQTTVTLVDEEGKKIEHVIPKSEFRKNIALFFFENDTADSTLNWLQYGISDMLGYDLSQDIFLQVINGYSFINYKGVKEAGFSKGVGLPLTLKLKIADSYHLRYFVSGKFVKQNEEYSVTTSLYKTKTGRLIEERKFKGTDIFKLVDEMSLQLKKDLEIPELHIEEVKDLPISELFTNSFSALKLYTLGRNAYIFDNDYKTATNYLEQVVKEDQAFAFAYHVLEQVYGLSNQTEKRVPIVQKLMQQLLYKFPERMQFFIKVVYYTVVKQDLEKRFDVTKIWVDLYPDDIEGHNYLALFYFIRNQIDESISEYKRILELDPEQYDNLLVIGSLYAKKGEFDEALKYYKKYAGQFPEDYNSYTTIGDLNNTMGDYQQAKSHYEKALLLEPGRISILLSLANIEKMLGNFEEAFKQYEDALESSRTPQDSVKVYGSLESFYALKGQMSKSLEYMHLKLAEKEKFAPPLLFLFEDQLQTLGRYINAGKKDIALQRIQDIEAQLDPPLDKFISFGYLDIYQELEDADNIEKTIAEVEATIQTFKMEVNRYIVYHAQGRFHEIRGEYEDAILSYHKQLELQPTVANINRYIGKCYRKLKEFKKAEEHLHKTLKNFPFSPENNYEIALLYADMGKKEKALEHLKIALDVWKNADPEYKPAQKAREKLAEWR